MSAPTFTARFQLEPRDIRALSRHLSRSPQMIGRLAGAFLVFLVALGVFLFLYTRQLAHHLSNSQASQEAVFAPVLLFFVFSLFVLYLQKSPVPRNITQHPTTFSLSGEGVSHQCGVGHIETKWRDVPQVETTADHLFLWTTNQILIVPRRAFDSNEEFARFCDFARQRCEEHKPNVPPIATV